MRWVIFYMIKRTKYLNKIIPFIDKPLIKALIGVHRCGKTVLLTQIKEYLINNGISQNQILYINFESFIYKKYLDGNVLYEHVIKSFKSLDGKKYIFSLMKYKMSRNGKKYLRPSLSILTVIFILQVQILNYYLVNLQRILQDVMYTLTYIHLLSMKPKNFL